MTPALPAIIIDTREQTPFRFGDDIRVVPGTLATGDYSLRGLEELVAIERKSLSDLCGCIGTGRDRFKRELHRLQAYRCKAVIIEATVAEVMTHRYRSKVSPASIMGSVAKWQCRYSVPFMFADHHGAAVCLSLLRNFHQYMCETMRAIMPDQ